MTVFLMLAMAAAPPAGACRTLEGDRILARDLAGAAAAFGSLPPESEMAPAPAPGARRLFGAAELARLAGRLGLTLEEPGTACFERRLRPREQDSVRAALEQALAGRPARLELLDYSRAPAPDGALEFPPQGLTRPAAGGASYWRGRIRYAPRRTFPFWARVRVGAERPRVVAREPLAAGRPVRPESVEVRLIEGSPFEAPAPASLEEVAGRVPRRAIPAGQVIAAGQLADAPAVEAGAAVEVEARVGGARLSLRGVAGSAGRAGDTVVVRNPHSGKNFKAVVQGQGRVAAGEAARENQ